MANATSLQAKVWAVSRFPPTSQPRPPHANGDHFPPDTIHRVNPLVGGKTVALSEAEGTPISAGLYSPFARTDATSYSAMPVATAAFKDSTADEIGIETI